MIKKLRVFDFDGTLFNSPEPPSWWEDKDGWWGDAQSLKPPALDEKPADSWWIGSTVTAVQEGNADPETYVVLLTGRKRDVFSGRVHELIRQKGLEFDEVHLTDQPDTQAFKTKEIGRILDEHPKIERVDLWEDMVRMVRPYRAVVEKEGVEFELHKVKVESRQADFPEKEAQEKEAARRVLRRFLTTVG